MDDDPSTLKQEIAHLAAEAQRLRGERDAYKGEFEALKAKVDESISARLRLLSVDLTKGVRSDFLSLLKLAGAAAAIALTVAAAGGYLTLSNLTRTLVDKQVKEEVNRKKADIESLHTNMINAVVDFKTEAKKALNDTKAETGRVHEPGERARREIGARVSRTTISPMPQGREGAPEKIIIIPVVVHVVYRDAEQNISDEQIRSQISVLNADFRAKNADIAKVPDVFKPLIGDAGIEFQIATIDPSGRPSTGITRTKTTRTDFGTDDAMKSQKTGGQDPWDTERFLNIWVCALGNGMLNLAQYPGGGPKETDGIVINYRTFGTIGSAQLPFNGGRNTTQAVAKYLNLFNIWGNKGLLSCTDGDFVADTPAQYGPNWGKPTFPRVSCRNNPNGDMFMNFLDDVDDDAMHMFTKGQVLRMRETLQGPRKRLDGS